LPLPIRNGRPAARGFGELGLPRLADAPEMSVELVDSEEEPGGVTELGVTVAAPAIANAVHSLTGQRLRTLPLRLGSR
jgi:isoquinoline 1-oxidoreductase beta subunit